MGFEKIILGQYELEDFENLLIREKWIGDAPVRDYNYTPRRIINKKRLLLSLLLFEKIDAVTLSSCDLSRLIDEGVAEPESCIVAGTACDHPTINIVDTGWECKSRIVSVLYVIIEQLLRHFRLDIYPESIFSKEDLLDLCDSFLFGDTVSFEYQFNQVIDQIMGKFMYIDSEYDAWQMKEAIHDRIDTILKVLTKQKIENKWFSDYCDLHRQIQTSIQYYSVPSACFDCDKYWQDCVDNSEFFGTIPFSCKARESLGAQRFSKFNGLISSNTQNATLFDNSLRFKMKKPAAVESLFEDVYHIVNVDLSNDVGCLPVPNSVAEAIRLRSRPEIRSFRNVFLSWCENMYNGDVSQAEYIKKDFEKAERFFKKQEMKRSKKMSIFHCTCEIVGNQIPYLSNLFGVISPICTLTTLHQEEKFRWILLTR